MAGATSGLLGGQRLPVEDALIQALRTRDRLFKIANRLAEGTTPMAELNVVEKQAAMAARPGFIREWGGASSDKQQSGATRVRYGR